MRQGCPVAAYLYILQAEPMADTIRTSKHGTGIHLPSDTPGRNYEARIAAFEDNTHTLLTKAYEWTLFIYTDNVIICDE